MRTQFRERFLPILEQALPWIVLSFLLLYTYGKFAEHPYYGFRWDTQTGRVIFIHVETQGNPTLQIGDRLVMIGAVSWEDFHADLQKTLFDGVRVGQIVPLVVERAGKIITISWRYPGPNPTETQDLFVNEGWLAYIFWIVGTVTWILVRPKDERRSLMSVFSYLTAIWITAGSGISAYHIWYSALILRAGVWLCVPVYLHLHWVFPKSLGKLPPWLLWGGYLGAIAFGIGEWLQVFPRDFYFFGLLLAAAGSLVLLVIHVIKQPETRRDLRLLLFAAILAFLPSIGLGLVGSFGSEPVRAGGMLLGLPLIPFAYFYAAYRRQLSGLEVRVNRIISIYIYLLLLATVMLFPMTWLTARYQITGVLAIIEIIIIVFVAFVSILGFSSFQAFVERRLLGIPLPPKNIQEIYASRITTSASLSGLVQLLKDDVLPSLLVRQFIFLRLEKGKANNILVINVTEEQIPRDEKIASLLATAGKYRPINSSENTNSPSTSWIRIAFALRVENELIGLWGFGRRDPDDSYSQAEITILQSLADQTAIALSNILQTERLRTMYQANINRFEKERLRLALDLHDSVLNQLATLSLSLDEANLSPAFQQSYDRLTQRLREIVSDLRPPMLSYGLKLAIESLADNIMERSADELVVNADIQIANIRYPADIEQHIFRIVQEACENALHHAHAKKISIYGEGEPERIDLHVEDDGKGFNAGEDLDLDRLLATKHFGLAGMVERAALIGAKIKVASRSKRGTQVHITWTPKPE